jgi:hypothetical protein
VAKKKRKQIMPSSSKKVERYTPAWIFEALGIVFDLDPCAPRKACPSKRWCRDWITLPDDGLAYEWNGTVWLNPPWTRGAKVKWVERLAEHGNGIALVRGGIDSAWLHDNRPNALFLFRGRIEYVRGDRKKETRAKGETGGLEPSMLLCYGRRCATAVRAAARDLDGMFCTVAPE